MQTMLNRLLTSTAAILVLTATSSAQSLYGQNPSTMQDETGQARSGQSQEMSSQSGTPDAAESGDGQEPFADIASWHYDELYDGISADWLLDRDVYGINGNHVGEVHNIFVSPDGTVDSIVVEGGGFLDIGDQHFKVPWDQVTLAAGGSVQAPVREENVNEFTMFEDEEVEAPEVDGRRAFRVTELIDDYVHANSGQPVGYIHDVVFSREGDVQAILMQANTRYASPGYYAAPFYGYRYGWHPGYAYYVVPFDEAQLAQLQPFDRERFNVDSSASDEDEPDS